MTDYLEGWCEHIYTESQDLASLKPIGARHSQTHSIRATHSPTLEIIAQRRIFEAEYLHDLQYELIDLVREICNLTSRVTQ